MIRTSVTNWNFLDGASRFCIDRPYEVEVHTKPTMVWKQHFLVQGDGQAGQVDSHLPRHFRYLQTGAARYAELDFYESLDLEAQYGFPLSRE
jgi:hypothetical protein